MPDQIPKVPIEMVVNGKSYTREVEPRLLLVDLLREELNLTGTHIGCDTTFCGTCTVLLSGVSVKSCTVFAAQADKGEILTAEGLAQNGEMHPLQQAFSKCHALQCGYCTPGFLMSAYALLSKNPNPNEKDVRTGVAGNLCRCTGYLNIFKAVQLAAEQMQGQK